MARNKPRFTTNTNFDSITLSIELLQNPDLTMSQKVIYAFIEAGFIGSQKDLANLVGMDRRSTGDRLLELADKGFIKTTRIGLYNVYTVTTSVE